MNCCSIPPWPIPNVFPQLWLLTISGNGFVNSNLLQAAVEQTLNLEPVLFCRMTLEKCHNLEGGEGEGRERKRERVCKHEDYIIREEEPTQAGSSHLHGENVYFPTVSVGSHQHMLLRQFQAPSDSCHYRHNSAPLLIICLNIISYFSLLLETKLLD